MQHQGLTCMQQCVEMKTRFTSFQFQQALAQHDAQALTADLSSIDLSGHFSKVLLQLASAPKPMQHRNSWADLSLWLHTVDSLSDPSRGLKQCSAEVGSQ